MVQALLEVVHDLFEEQTSTESVVLKIMQRAQTLLKCERCSVLLRDGTSEVSIQSQCITGKSWLMLRQRFRDNSWIL